MRVGKGLQPSVVCEKVEVVGCQDAEVVRREPG